MQASRLARLAGVGILAIGAASTQAAFVEVAFAGIPTGQERVRFSDLDLNKSADVVRLYQRIRTAALSACGAEVLTGTHLLTSAQENCVNAAIATAVAQVHNAQLSTYLRLIRS